MNKLTKRQDEIYQFLLEHFEEFDYPPSLDELCLSLGMTSRGSLHKHIQALINAGLVEPMSGKQRGVRLTLADVETDTLPYLGKIAAGHPLEAIENPERIPVPEYLRTHGQCYVLRVSGDSMIEAGILDGDMVIIEKCDIAKSQDIVVALIDNYEATLKRYENAGAITILHPANGGMKPFVFKSDRVKIQGKLVGQMRTYT